MKKAFIQKLSIAMASALVITAAMPATADAAAAMKMNRATKTLYLNEDNMTNTADTYDFSIKNKGTNYKTKYTFNWYAENDSIVSVAKGGVVTAKKVGKTTVKCDVIKKSSGKVYKTVSAVVTVKANADKVTIKNAPENNEMAIGTIFDFNRTMKAENGGSATDKTEWIVSADKEGKETTDVASVDKNGVVTALKAGKFFITAKTYQSAATKELGYTAISDPVEVTAYASITEAKNTSKTKISLTLDTDMSKTLTKDNVVVTNASGVKQVVKSVGFNADGTVATVELWSPMTDKVVYKVSVPEVKPVEFTASIGAPASVVVTGPSLVADNEATELKYVLKDANGVEVDAAATGKVVFSTTAPYSEANIFENKLTVYQIGKVIPVKATYYTGTYDSNYNEIKIESEVFSITCVDSVAPTVASATTATITSKSNGKDADWANTSMVLPVNDANKFLQLKYVNSNNETKYTNNGEADVWAFESTDTSKLLINPVTGQLTPLAEGQVVVIAKCGSFQNSYTITISAKREAASVTPDVSGVVLSNSDKLVELDSKTVKLTVKDNYGEDFADSSAVTYTILGTTANQDQARSAVTVVEGTNSITFKANKNGAEGTYTYRVKKCGKEINLSVTVRKPSSTVSRATVKVDTNEFDTKVATGSAVTTKAIKVSLAELASNEVVIRPLTSGVKYTVKHSDGTEYKVGEGHVVDNQDGTYSINPVIVSGGTYYDKMKAGTYTITANIGNRTDSVYDAGSNNMRSITPVTFVIKDTQSTTDVTVKTRTLEVNKVADLTNDEYIKAQLKNCFELANKSQNFTVSGIKTAVVNNAVGKDTGVYSVFVEKVTVTESIDGVDLNVDKTVNATITVTVK